MWWSTNIKTFCPCNLSLADYVIHILKDSIFRNANGNCVVNGTNLHYHFKRMIMQEHYGLVKLRVERKDYSGLRNYIDQINDDSAN